MSLWFIDLGVVLGPEVEKNDQGGIDVCVCVGGGYFIYRINRSFDMCREVPNLLAYFSKTSHPCEPELVHDSSEQGGEGGGGMPC